MCSVTQTDIHKALALDTVRSPLARHTGACGRAGSPCVAQIPYRQSICAPGKTWSKFKPNINKHVHLGTRHEWPSVQARRLLTMGSTIQSGGFPHVSYAVNNRPLDNGSACFSPRTHHPFRRTSFEAEARRWAALWRLTSLRPSAMYCSCRGVAKFHSKLNSMT